MTERLLTKNRVEEMLLIMTKDLNKKFTVKEINTMITCNNNIGIYLKKLKKEKDEQRKKKKQKKSKKPTSHAKLESNKHNSADNSVVQVEINIKKRKKLDTTKKHSTSKRSKKKKKIIKK